MHIREAVQSDWPAIWAIFKPIARLGETYAYARNISSDEAKEVWLTAPFKTFVYEKDRQILATYYLKTNQQGPGNHVCNCGYMVADSARGKGLATVMCEHSQLEASKQGYKAMQFNFVASSNTGAIRLWKKLNFDVVGTLPKAFNHPAHGFIDALLMYKWLGNQ